PPYNDHPVARPHLRAVFPGEDPMSDPTPNITGSPPPATPPTNAPAAPTATASKPPPAPPKPPARPVAKGKGADRRGFLTWFAAGMAGMTGALGLMTLGTLRFLFPLVLAEPPSRVKVGFPEGFEEGKVVDKFKDQNIWVVRDQGKIYALSTTC